MPGIPIEVQCFADPEKVCPLRAAQHEVAQLHEVPVEERTTVDDYNAQVKEIGKALSGMDRQRFYAMQGTMFGRSTLEERSCDSGPSKSWGFVGRMVCNAETRYEEWETSPKQAA